MWRVGAVTVTSRERQDACSTVCSDSQQSCPFMMGIQRSLMDYLHDGPGPCITNVFATRRKNFSQWHRSFQRKLRSHWLKVLRHVAITLVIQGPGSTAQNMSMSLRHCYIPVVVAAVWEHYSYMLILPFPCVIPVMRSDSKKYNFHTSHNNLLMKTTYGFPILHYHMALSWFYKFMLSLPANGVFSVWGKEL